MHEKVSTSSARSSGGSAFSCLTAAIKVKRKKGKHSELKLIDLSFPASKVAEPKRAETDGWLAAINQAQL